MIFIKLKRYIAITLLLFCIYGGVSGASAQEYYQLSQYDADFVACSQIADRQYSGHAEPRQFQEVQGTDQQWMDFFNGCMASRGYNGLNNDTWQN